MPAIADTTTRITMCEHQFTNKRKYNKRNIIVIAFKSVLKPKQFKLFLILLEGEEDDCTASSSSSSSSSSSIIIYFYWYDTCVIISSCFNRVVLPPG